MRKKLSFTLLLLIGVFIACKKDKDSKIETFKNIGSVVYNERTKLFYDSSGKQINLDDFRKNGELLTVTSLEVVNDGLSNEFSDPDFIGKYCGYKVIIDNYQWWGGGMYDEGGDIGVNDRGQYFVFRPGRLNMREGEFKYRGNDWKSHHFLQKLYESDPTFTVYTLTGDCGGPAFKFN